MRLHPLLSDLLQWPFSARQRRRLTERDRCGRAAFIARFPGEAKVAGVVWELLRDEAACAGFTPAAEDELLHLWGLAEEDLDDLVLEAMRRSGCRIPTPRETDRMPALTTVADLVRFVARFAPASTDSSSR